MAMLIGNGRIVNAEGDCLGDVLLEDGKVRMLGRDLPSPAGAEIDDASGAGRSRRPHPPRLGVRQRALGRHRFLGHEGMGEFLKRGESRRR